MSLRWIGLTGGIASGKSTVCRILEDLGMAIVDADILSRKVMAVGGAAYEDVFKAFGPSIRSPDGCIDRVSLGRMVFSDDHKRQLLESIVHPLIRIETQSLRERLKKEGVQIAFNDVPLLFENGLESQYDKVLVVYCRVEQQLQRLCRRESLSSSEALLQINSQMPLEKKRSLASFVIDNTGDFKGLEESLREALRYLGKGSQLMSQKKG